MEIPLPIGSKLIAARCEKHLDRAWELFEEVLIHCADWEKTDENGDAFIIAAQTHAEMALEEIIPHKRADRWKKAFKTLEPKLKAPINPYLVEAYASLAVDYFQDSLVDIDMADRLALLRGARQYVDQAISDSPEKELRAQLLARKSSILRHLALCEASLRARRDRLAESSRCAARAIEEARIPATVLEKGLAEWALSTESRTIQ